MILSCLKTTKQVAKMLECSTRNVAYHVVKGKLNPVLILENGSFLFNSYDVEQFKLKNLKA